MEENNMDMEGGAGVSSPEAGGGRGMRKITGLVVAVVIIIIVIFVLSNRAGAPEPEQNMAPEEKMETNMEEAGEAVGAMTPDGGEKEEGQTNAITYSDSGYSPAALTIKKGDTLVFTNQSSQEVWPASALHPTHTVYPGSDINKCGTAQASEIFDACRGLAAGEQWSFQFNEVGQWKYHNHLNPSHFGAITVSE